MFHQYTFTMISKATQRNEVVYCTHSTAELARDVVVAMYEEYSVAEKPQAVGIAHSVYGEIDCT